MLELRPLKAGVIACLSAPHELDGVVVPDALGIRIAPDELLLITEPKWSERVAADAQSTLSETALVVDQTDAFAGWTLHGSSAFEAFARLSAVPLPRDRPTVLQGLVAHVPAKILVAPEGLDLLVQSTLGHHVRERVIAACADLGVREEAGRAFVASAHAGASEQ